MLGFANAAKRSVVICIMKFSVSNLVTSLCMISIFVLSASASSGEIRFCLANQDGWKIDGLKEPSRTIAAPANSGLRCGIAPDYIKALEMGRWRCWQALVKA